MIILYLMIKFLPMMWSMTKETSIAEYGTIQIIDQLSCYIIRDERLIKSSVEGDIKYFAQEGEKVEKGYRIAEIYKDTVDYTTRRKLEVVNQRIDNIKSDENNLFQSDVTKINEDVEEIIQSIQESKQKNDLLKIEQLKKELDLKLEKMKIISGDKSFAGKNLETLKAEQEQLEEKINASVLRMKSPISGIISYSIDGYEDVLTPQNMTTLESNKLKDIKSEVTDLQTEKVIQNQPLFKVVNSHIWYMITYVEENQLENYKEGKMVTFKFPSGEVKGKIFRVIESKKKNMIVFQIDQYNEKFFNTRKIDLEVIAVNYEGLKLYKDSLIQKDGKKGVYVLDINRYARFKPVKVLGYDEDYIIVQNNIFYEKEGEEIKAVATIKLYDEIVRNASKIKEGQMIY